MESIFKHFSKAIEAYKRNFTPIALAVLLMWIISFLSATFGFFAVSGNVYESMEAGYYFLSGEGTEDLYLSNQLNTNTLGLFLLILIIGGIITMFLQAGLWGLCLEGIKGKTELNAFFTAIEERGISYIFSIALVSLLALSILFIDGFIVVMWFILVYYLTIASHYLVTILLLILTIVVFLTIFLLSSYIFITCMFIYPAVISGKKIFASLKESMSIGRENYFDMFRILLLYFLIWGIYIVCILFSMNFLGYLLIIFLNPLILLTFCSYYLEYSKKAKPGVAIIGTTKIKAKKKVAKPIAVKKKTIIKKTGMKKTNTNKRKLKTVVKTTKTKQKRRKGKK